MSLLILLASIELTLIPQAHGSKDDSTGYHGLVEHGTADVGCPKPPQKVESAPPLFVRRLCVLSPVQFIVQV